MEPQPIRIEPVQPGDQEVLRALSIQTFVQAFGPVNTEANMQSYIAKALSLERLREEWTHPGSEWYFARKEETPVGYLKINTGDAQSDLKEEAGLEIERIYVLQEYLGLSVGQALLAYALQKAEEKGAPYIWLGVWEHNARAIRFYEKNGFTVFGRHDFLLGEDRQTDLLMKRPLP